MTAKGEDITQKLSPIKLAPGIQLRTVHGPPRYNFQAKLSPLTTASCKCPHNGNLRCVFAKNWKASFRKPAARALLFASAAAGGNLHFWSEQQRAFLLLTMALLVVLVALLLLLLASWSEY